MPRWAQSIRFRLSLAYALAVFAAGSILVAGVYLWQVRQLDEPILLRSRTVRLYHPDTLEPLDLQFTTNADLAEAYLTQFERLAYRESLEQLRRASLGGLSILFVVAFGTGWVLAGWTLQPMGRMAAVAREVSGSELSRRIDLHGPDDELKALADTFDAMLDRVQASFEDQRRFVQDTSHEIRNPLAITQANLELVIDDPDATPEELRAAARIAHASAGRVARTVDELVDQARQGIPFGPTALVDVGALARDVCADLTAGARARDLTLDLTFDPALDPALEDGVAEPPTGSERIEVRGDEPALRRALTNLVTNAIRLAPAGSRVRIGVGRADDGMVRLDVRDEGPGIEPDDQERIFERFQRVDTSGNGLGLGLNIVRQIMDRHGGRVEVESDPGVGSTFSLYLPTQVRR